MLNIIGRVLLNLEQLVFYLVNVRSGDITSGKINEDGVLEQFKNDALPNSRDLRYFLFQSLPIGQERNKVKFLFYTIPGVVTGNIKMENVILHAGFKFHAIRVCVSSNYVPIFTSSIGPEDLRERQQLLVLLDIQIESKNCYRFVELCQNNLEELIGEFLTWA